MIETALQAYLTSVAGVTALIGTRLYPTDIPQDAALPAVAYQVTTTTPDHNHDGPSALAEKLFQFTIDADTYLAAKNVAAAIRQALDGRRSGLSGITNLSIFWTNEYDGYAEQQDRQTVRQDYQVTYREA